MSENTIPPQVRHRKRRKRRRKKRRLQILQTWLLTHSMKILLILLFVVAIIPLIDLLSIYTVTSRRLVASPVGWLFKGYTSQILGGLLLLITMIIGAHQLRTRIIYDVRYSNRTCPKCQYSKLKRIHRTRLDRLICRFNIPVRRYICSSCHWSGIRIDESKLWPTKVKDLH